MNNPDLADTSTWTLSLRLIVILACCLLLTGVAYIALLQAQQQQLAQVKNTHQHLYATFEQHSAKTIQLPRQQADHAALRNALDQQVQPASAPGNTADLLVAVSQIGLSAEVDFTTFQPQTSVTHDLYVETPITLGVTGQYHNLAAFISDLTRHPGIMTLHDMVLQRTTPDPAGKKNQQLSLTFTLKAYQITAREIPSAAQTSSAPPTLPAISPIIYAADSRRDPFTPPRHQSTISTKHTPRPQGVLQRYALNTLRMVGTISQPQQHWGLLQDPDGQIHRVNIGSYVGRNQGRIQAIHPDKIIVHEHPNADGQVRHITLRQTIPQSTKAGSAP